MKPTSSSAATTAFCSAKIEGPGGHLWIDGNGKITVGNGTMDAPKPNAFSLVQIKDCPGSTESCRKAYYVHGLEKNAPDTHALYGHNSQMIREILASAESDLWAWITAEWIRENCPGGFRWHVSGDVFSADYAWWIVRVCRYAPEVRFWIYIRSFEFVEILAPISTMQGGNLSLNLSCDADNVAAAVITQRRFGGRLCYLTLDGNVPTGLPDESVIFPDYSLRGGTPAGQEWFAALPPSYKAMTCPVDYHGKSEQRRCGPCSRCLK